ncbi:MAG: hypothetical protein ACXVZZ_10060 [Terriglobales bacterium]
MPVVLLSIFASLLPSRYRGHWLGDGDMDVRRGAILSAVLQFVGCCIAIWALYPGFIQQRMAEASAVAAAGHPGDKMVEGFTVFAYGQFAALEYIFRPLTICLLYFACEGAVRIFSAVGSDVIIPCLPVQLFAWAHEYADLCYREAKLGERVLNKIEPGLDGQYDLKIYSCRPKNWNEIVSIRYNDELYELQSVESGEPPRRFVYLLRKNPLNKVLRGWQDYDPEEPLRKTGWAEALETPRK